MSVQVSYKKQTIFFIILIFITLVITEGLVRYLDLENSTCAFMSQEVFEDFTTFEKESLCYEYNHIEFNIIGAIKIPAPSQGQYVNINSNGFRGNELDPQSTDYRIFFLGGSTAFGFVTSTDDFTIPALLEKKLKNTGMNVTVINAGIPGANSMHERYYIETHIKKFSPNMIIMYDGWNDGSAYDYTNTYEEFASQSYYVNDPIATENNNRAGILNIGLSTFFREIDYKTGMGITQVLVGVVHPESITKQTVFDKENLSNVEKKLQNNWSKICEMGQKNDFQTVNILQPILGTSDRIPSNSESFNVYQGELHLISFELNNSQYRPCDEVYDLRNVFSGMDNIPIYFDRGHMSDQGNEIVAEAIYENIFPIVLEELKN